ncbi:MAG: GAF domain-containing protein, partial [Sphingobacteriales bacterium]
NLAHFLDLDVSELLGKPLAGFVMAQMVEEIKKNASRSGHGNNIPTQLYFSTRNRTLNCLAVLHLQENYLLLELEELKTSVPITSFVNVYQQIKQILNSLKKTSNTRDMLQIAADEIKFLSGFDRVMVYKFDSDWNGTVVAEAVIPELEPYLDLRFPASDIPKQARELYLRTPYRSIPDVGYKASPLVPDKNPFTGAPANLSDCSLRGVPDVHLEYLRNMGVGSSMSTSIIKDNALWGLISCHHRTAKFLSYELRSAFELLANIISSQLSARENEWVMREKSELAKMHVRLLELMTEHNDFIEGLTQPESPNILEYLRLTGAVLVNEGSTSFFGQVPNQEQIAELLNWLGEQSQDQIFYTDSLPKLFPAAAAYKNIGSGLLFIPLSGNNDACVIGFRPEVIQQVKWGGNPNEHLTITEEQGVKTLHPRNSFRQWKEIVQNTAEPWEEHE